MATGLNRVSLIGNLAKDPEVRFSQSGTAVGNLRLGVSERRKEGEEYKDHTEWVSVICFGKTAENVSKYLQKGRQVFVEGKLQTRQWEDKTGQTRYTTEVVAGQILFLGSGLAKEQGVSKPDSQVLEQNAGSTAGFIEEDDDLPF